jgi:hypothetical protein
MEEYFSRATVSNSMVFTLTTPFNADSDAPLAPSSLGMNVKLAITAPGYKMIRKCVTKRKKNWQIDTDIDWS